MWERLSAELVRALRGKWSQEAVNRRLGYTSNALHTWETGARQPRASDFFRLAALTKIAVPKVLERFALRRDLRLPSKLDQRTAALFIANLVEGHSAVRLAAVIGCNRNTVSRWIAGTTEPRLPELLRLVDAVTHRLMDFVAAFADPSTLPAVSVAYRDLMEQRRIAYELPWSHAVLRVLELSSYKDLPRHEDGFIASRIGITREREREYLRALSLAKQIRKRGGKWVVLRILTVDTGTDPARNIELKQHWARVGVERLDTKRLESGALFSYNLFAISEDGLEKLRAAHLEYYERLRAIVAESKDPERLFLANVQLIPLDR
jgi:transcriptional regulator with XRE-family HTH domain